MPVMKFRREPLNNISKGNHSNGGRRIHVAYMRLNLKEQLLKKEYYKKHVELLFRGALTLRLQRITPIYIKKCLIYFGWDIIWKNRELSFFIMCWNATLEKKLLILHSEDTQSGNFESNPQLVQKIRFAINLKELKKVVSNPTGNYFELAVGITSKSEFVAVFYSNSIDTQAGRIDVNGKACPPSRKCTPAN